MSAEIKWKTIAVASLKGNTKEMLPEYEKLYSGTLKHNPFFLYNYGAELNVAEDYSKSILLLSECRNKFNDYDLQMLLADSYYHTGDTIEAVNTYQYASNMIPCRFLPLYNMANIYLERGDSVKAVIIANKILKKTVKVPSSTVNFIKAEMKQLINPKK